MDDLSGLKALVVEDEAGVAMMIEDMLQDLGCQIAASVAQLKKACDAARTTDFDFAILDVNLKGDSAIPVAEIIRERGIPFLFSTGYGAMGAPSGFKEIPVLSKPFVIEDLRKKIAATLTRANAKN